MMRPVRVFAALAAGALLAGCGLFSPPPEPPKLLTRAEADARTEVPFTRGVRLDKAGRIVDVTFDAPAVADPEMPWLKLGLRLYGQEPNAPPDVADKVREGGLKLQIHLERVGAASAEPIVLSRPSNDGRSMVPLPADGLVNRVYAGSVNIFPLKRAGLYYGDDSYRVLEIADAGLIDAGRYRVTVDAVDDRPEYSNLQIEFIAAYYSLGK